MNVGDNLLAVRLDNPTDSARWYPGARLYRNVWLVTVDMLYVGQYGTYITTPSVSAQAATVDLAVVLENKGGASRAAEVLTEAYEIDPATGQAGATAVATFPKATATVAAGSTVSINNSTTVTSPRLWGPPPAQTPNLYVARTTVYDNNTVIDVYDTLFGIRLVTYDANKGVLINGQAVRVQGTNNHHDQGSLGSAFHNRAAERQLQMLQEMGCNTLRMSHNPLL